MKRIALVLLLVGTAHAADDLAALEKTFWVCDYLASTYGPQAVPIPECVQVTEDVRVRRFKNDYERFLQWWKQNKEAEYSKLRRLTGGKS